VLEQGRAIDRRLAVFSELKEKIGNIQSASMNMIEMTRELTGGINNLRNIFTATTTRGVSGEVMLENLLRQLIPHNYQIQYSFGAEKVDAVIRLDKMIVPIDAKFPYFDRFNEMMAVDTSTVEGEKERARRKRELKKSIRDMIEDVQRKYIRPDLGTSNFAMIYIPAENIYYELVVNDADGEITNFANQKNVVLVSPSTLFSYLMIVQYGLKGLKLEEETETIFKHIETLARDMNNFKSDFEVLAGHLTHAYNKLNETNQSLLKIEARFESALSSDSSMHI
jgi:DNA recombination protein RmuC